MAIINCPHCQGKLRFPDDLPPRKVKCPACSNSFLAGPQGPIEEKVVPPKPKKPEPPKPVAKKPVAAKPIPKKPAPSKPAPKEEVESDFDFNDDKPTPARRRDLDDDDRPRSKRRDDDEDDNRDRKRRSRDDEEDDKPRSKRRDDDEDRDRKRRDRDEDDDDRPRSHRRNDDDDENDQPRSKRRDWDEDEDYVQPRSKRRDRDDENDDERPRSRERDDDRPKSKDNLTQWRNARQGINLVGIAFWCQVAALGIVIFTLFLIIVVGEYVEELYIPAGLAGFANWVLACVGFSFFVAGPKKGNLLGLTIALIAVTAVHLFMVVYLSFQKESMFLGARGGGSIQWNAMPTQFQNLTGMMISSIFVTTTFIAGLLELARFILYCLVLKEYGRICKDRGTSSAGMMQLIMLPSVLGISLLLFLILKLIYKNAGGGSEGKYILFLILLIEFGGYIFVYVMSALSTGKAKDAMRSRPR